jgi:hypothetical protein
MELRKNIGRICILLVLVFFLAIGSSYAQRLTGKLMGTVTDDEGLPLPGVTMEISSLALMGGVHAQITSEKGSYRFLNLPPGTYKLVLSLAGFQKVERLNLKVNVGRTTTENIALKPTTIEVSVTVTAESPIIDVTQSGVSTTFDKDLLEKIPTGRLSFLDVVKQAPGIQQAGQDSYFNVAFGSNMESNAYYLDGIDISNPDTGCFYLLLHTDAFEEIETSGIGSPAEYGQFTGAVVNVVTKSGGNKFSGSVSYYGQFDWLTADNNSKEALDPDIAWEDAYLYPDSAYSYHRAEFYYLTFNLGGPIVKDKVWFFASYKKAKDSVAYWNVHPDYPKTRPSDIVFFKLSAQITNKHKLVGSFYYEVFEEPDIIDPWLEKEAAANYGGTIPAWNLIHTWMISNNAYLEWKYSGWISGSTYEPMYSDYDTPGHWDWATGVSSQGVWWPWFYDVSRHQANANLSYFAEDFLGGDHDFKIGVQYVRGRTDCQGGYAGGRAYTDYSYSGQTYPYYMYEQDVFRYGGVMNAAGAFLDDSWKIGDRLTLNLGLRFDYSNASIPSYPVYEGWNETGEMTDPVEDIIVWNTFSPRIGLAFQLTSDQKTLLKASYGRYYDANYSSNWMYPGPNVPDWTMYWWDGAQWVFWDMVPGGMAYTIDPDLKNPYADQFSLGIERELSPGFSLGATFIYKIEKNLIGWEDRGGEYVQVSRTSPDNGETYTVWNQTIDTLGLHDYWITNPADYEQTYKAVMLTLVKRYSNNWMLNASLTWSKNEGLNMTSHSTWQHTLIWFAEDFGKDPNDLINAKGLITNDRTWIFKLQAGYTFPWDILASINFISQTGRPKLKLVSIYGLNQDPWGLGLEILAEPRNTDNRLPTWTIMDFRLQKTFNIYQTVKLQAIFDVFNVFNSNTVTSHASYAMWSEAYEKPDWILYPRRVQVGLRLEF